MNYNKQEILQLPVEEKLALVMELWESIEEKTNELPVPDWKIKLIKERLSLHEQNPAEGTDWDVLRKKYLA